MRSHIALPTAALLAALSGLACEAPLETSAAASTTRPVTLLVEPDAGASAVRDLFTSARTSLWMEMYLLTDGATVDALVERRRAGVDVRVVLEQHPYQADGANDDAFARLTAAGALVAWSSPRFALTHAKTIVVDHQRLVVLTLNLTRAGLTANREYAVVDDEPRDVAAAEAMFRADLAGAPAPAAAGRVLASPTSTRPALVGAIGRASRSVVIEVEELSDVGIIDALAAARARGCTVSVALPGAGTSAATQGAARHLVAAGVDVRLVDVPTVHAKAVIVDDWLYVGSANLTTASLDANRELGLGLHDEAALRAVARTIADDLARGRLP